MTTEFSKKPIKPFNPVKALVRGIYDLQKLRVSMGNRIVGNFKAKIGQAPGESEETLDPATQALLKTIRETYKLVASGAVVELEQNVDSDEADSLAEDASGKKDAKLATQIVTLINKQYDVFTEGKKHFPTPKKFTGNPVISTYTELCLIAQYVELERQEANHFKRLGGVLLEYPIYTEFLEKIPGIGPAMAGVILSEVDITEATYASSLWAYAGLDVAQDGKGRSKQAAHLVDTQYLDKDKNVQTKKSITFNPFFKTKMVGVLGSSFLRAGEKCKYSLVYRNYKHRLENMPAHADKTKGHRHAMAMRFMVKAFLAELYIVWRTLEGLPVASSYAEGKLGMPPHHEGKVQ